METSLRKRITGFVLGGIVIAVVVLCVLPWLAREGYAGPLVLENVEQHRDASALFYTESERVMEIAAEW
jgi:hypothetical protein